MDPPTLEPATPVEPRKTPTLSVITKKRYTEFAQYLIGAIGDESITLNALDKFQEIFKYDPAKPSYNPETAKKTYQRLKEKAQEQGTSLYKLKGQDAFYERHKDVLNQKRSEHRRIKKSEGIKSIDQNQVEHVFN
jgi:hypothetical protein